MAKRKTLGPKIREKIQVMILNGELPCGAKLVQQDLAAKFNVAQCVVREALLELKSYGLVEAIHNHGMYVSDTSVTIIRQSFEVREMHEGMAARLCCRHINRQQVRELREIAENIYIFFQKNKLNEMSLLDGEFHSRLLQIAGNKVLARLKECYWGLGKVLRVNRNPGRVRDEHIGILNAIEEGNEEKAEKLMRQHIRAAGEEIEKLIQKGVFKPAWIIPG